MLDDIAWSNILYCKQGDGYANALDLYTKNSALIKEVKYKIRCKRLGSEMELHPVLETDTFPNAGLWYVLSGYGEYPSMRVGESCSYIPGKTENDNGRLYVIGGANPSGPFCDTYILDLNTQKWDLIDAPGFRARYEHAAFTPACHPNKIYIFGGADQTGNMNDVQVFDTDANTWSSVSVSGNPPSERTYHTSSATVGNKFIVYSGGHCGPDPVSDRQVHCFDATSLSWTTLNIKGDSPKPRHGHVTVAIGNKVFIHGGMAGANFYNDLHVLNLEKNTWSDVKRKRIYPSARAGHSAVAIGTNVYIFGGMNRYGALDELYKLDTGKMKYNLKFFFANLNVKNAFLRLTSMTASVLRSLKGKRQKLHAVAYVCA